jgi:hypothetical protein
MSPAARSAVGMLSPGSDNFERRPMKLSRATFLTLIVAALLALAVSDAASARPRKTHSAPSVATDEDGTPIIMKGYHAPRITRDAQPSAGPARRAARSRTARGSGTYIPPPNPSPSGGPPAAALLQPGPGPYHPPPLNSFGDRVTGCLHSYPLNAGIGNNPVGQGAYVRSCAN